MPESRTKQKLAARQPVFGAMLNIPGARLVELCAYAGFDSVFIDLEHGSIGLESLCTMIRAA